MRTASAPWRPPNPYSASCPRSFPTRRRRRAQPRQDGLSRAVRLRRSSPPALRFQRSFRSPAGTVVFLGLGLLALSVCTKTIAADWITKLPLFDIAINEYLIVVSTMSLCVLAALGAERLIQGAGRRVFAAGALGSAALIVVLNASYRSSMYDLGTPPAYLRERLALQLAPLVFGAALMLWLRRKPSLTLGGALVVFTASRILEVGRINPTIPSQALFPDVPILSKIPRGSPERMAAVGATFIPNAVRRLRPGRRSRILRAEPQPPSGDVSTLVRAPGRLVQLRRRSGHTVPRLSRNALGPSAARRADAGGLARGRGVGRLEARRESSSPSARLRAALLAGGVGSGETPPSSRRDPRLPRARDHRRRERRLLDRERTGADRRRGVPPRVASS